MIFKDLLRFIPPVPIQVIQPLLNPGIVRAEGGAITNDIKADTQTDRRATKHRIKRARRLLCLCAANRGEKEEQI